MFAEVIPGEARSFLNDFLGRVQALFGDELVGMYFYGSVASGDFDPGGSDLDVVVAISRDLTDERLEVLRRLHVEIDRMDNPWARRLEVWYIPVSVLRRHDPATRSRCACVSPVSPFGETEPDDAWILNRHTVREKSPALAGPPAVTLIDPIDGQTIKRIVGNMLRTNWAKALDGPEWMSSRKHQAFTVLTMCRALYALEHGEMVSKPVAAAWAISTLDPSWASLIRQALSLRADPTSDDMGPTLEFVKFVVQSVDCRK